MEIDDEIAIYDESINISGNLKLAEPVYQQQLKWLLKLLDVELQKSSPEHVQVVKTVALRAKELVDDAAESDDPAESGENLNQAAQGIANILPGVPDIAQKIVALIRVMAFDV